MMNVLRMVHHGLTMSEGCSVKSLSPRRRLKRAAKDKSWIPRGKPARLFSIRVRTEEPPMKRVVSWYWLACSLLALAFLGCTIAEPPRIIPVSNPAVFRPKSPQQVKSLEQAMAAVMTVCSQDLGLPVVEPFYLHLYKDANAYAAYTFGFARLPEQIVRLTLALPQENRLHINIERTRGQPWGSLLRILAHEYAHNVEYVLISSARPWIQWIREGFADWVAAKVLDSLGWENYSTELARARQELSRYKGSLPKLTLVEDSRVWLNMVDQPKGKIITYKLAFIAVDKLIEKRGLSGMMNYFRSDDFQGSFGLTWSDFETELTSILTDLGEARAGIRKGSKAERPEWKVGYQWQYALKGPGIRTTTTSELIREDTFEGAPSYVLRIGMNEYLYTRDGLALLATLAGGRTIRKNNPPLQPLSWPLEVGKEWRSNIVVENLEQKSSQRMDIETVVANNEEVKVSAGTFETFKIEIYSFQTGELMWEHWYSPQIKWFVKSKAYRQEGVIEQELISFKLD